MEKYQMQFPFSSSSSSVTFPFVSELKLGPHASDSINTSTFGFGDHHHDHQHKPINSMHHDASNCSLDLIHVPRSSRQEQLSHGHGGCESVGTKIKMGKGREKKVRRPRIAFHTRSQVDILDDGYRWRKYGQKAVKNNKFPRSYYRCTHQGCNVKKQVQRLTKDEGVVVTTYEGSHTHPIENSTENFEHILSQMQIYYPPF